MSVYKKFIPKEYVSSIYEIDYEQLIKQGKKALLFDLDNTIINYDENILNEKQISFLRELQKDFTVVIVSNSRIKRVSTAVNGLFPIVSFARKPLKVGFKKALKNNKIKINETVMIGDQLMTDVFGGNRMGFYTILVEAVLRKSDKIWTRTNRKLEKIVLKKIKKYENEKYMEVLSQYAKRYE